MRCHICDREDNNIWIDKRDDSWFPCYHCASIIGDCLFDDEDDDEYVLIEENELVS